MTFRSEQMQHYQLIIPREIAWEVTNYLGEVDTVHLEDISNPLNKPFYSQVKRCEESLQKINAITNFLKEKRSQFEKYSPLVDPNYAKRLFQKWQDEARNTNVNPSKKLNTVEEDVTREWESFQELNRRTDKINYTLKTTKGTIAAFAAASEVLGKNYFGAGQVGLPGFKGGQLQEKMGMNVTGLSYLVGLIQPSEQARIAKIIFRVSRGFACTYAFPSQSFGLPELQGLEEDVIFVFFPTSERNTLQKKLQRVIESFCNNLVQLPASEAEFNAEKAKLMKMHYESNELLGLINKEISGFIRHITNINMLEEWRIFLTKEKALYEALNKMQVRDQFLTARFYIPAKDIDFLLNNCGKMSPAPIFNELRLKKPPSKFELNDFLFPGQQIVETYGIPRYGEINPGVFTCVTFPFFFGVMFGDIAHGFVLFCFGLFLVWKAEALKATAFATLVQIRYLIAMMGFFAFYCGFIYNDFLGVSLNLFGSCYDMPKFGPGESYPVYPKPGCVYPFGVDPGWSRAQNELQYVNSLKMKLAVIIAVVHMTFGIFLKAVNSRYFKKTLDFWFEFIPQIIFMVILFGYMDFLIIFKWLKPFPNTADAPSIITAMINIPLKMGHCTQQPGGGNMWGNSWDDTSQNMIQLIILLVALFCVPMMLIPKPWIEIRHLKHAKKVDPLLSEADIQKELMSKQEEEEPHPEPGEIVVHQIIETIEFILGSISNTASYLRLWALSLAHSQLSRVFFQKTVGSGFEDGYSSLPMLIIGFYFLSWVTFGVLMCMDSMECFLHALRLHWVEFQNKFFKADGVKFVPFSFNMKVNEMKEADNE